MEKPSQRQFTTSSLKEQPVLTEEVLKKIEEYKKAHPIDPFAPPSTKTDVTFPQNISRPEFSERTWGEQAKVLFTTDFKNGEKYYWDDGLRDSLIKQGKQGIWIATDGTKLFEGNTFEDLIAPMTKHPTIRFFFAKVGEEGILPSAISSFSVNSFNPAPDSRPTCNVIAFNPINSVMYGPSYYVDDTGSVVTILDVPTVNALGLNNNNLPSPIVITGIGGTVTGTQYLSPITLDLGSPGFPNQVSINPCHYPVPHRILGVDATSRFHRYIDGPNQRTVILD